VLLRMPPLCLTGTKNHVVTKAKLKRIAYHQSLPKVNALRLEKSDV